MMIFLGTLYFVFAVFVTIWFIVTTIRTDGAKSLEFIILGGYFLGLTWPLWAVVFIVARIIIYFDKKEMYYGEKKRKL